MGTFIQACSLAKHAFHCRFGRPRDGRGVELMDEFLSAANHQSLRFLPARTVGLKVVVIDLDDVIFTIKPIPGIFRKQVFGIIQTSFGLKKKLCQIREREGDSVKFVLATNSSRKHVAACLGKTNLAIEDFDDCLCASEKKPAVLQISKKFNVPPNEIVLIEDSFDEKKADLGLLGVVKISPEHNVSRAIIDSLMQDEFTPKSPSSIISLPMVLELAMCFYGNHIFNHPSVLKSIDEKDIVQNNRGYILREGAVIRPAPYPAGPTYAETLKKTFFRLKGHFDR